MPETPAIARRTFGLLGAASLLPLLGCARDPGAELTRLELRLGGRVGVVALDTGSGLRIAHRADERFAMCSTFKWLLAAVVLARVDKNRYALDDLVPVAEADLLDHAPVVKTYLERGMVSLRTLCAAVVEQSDNAAANLLIRHIGGAWVVAQNARNIGDFTTRLDRTEPTLNSNVPGDPRDTTTPEAMVGTMQKVLLGDLLTTDSREMLLGWMKGTKTAPRLSAGLPADWVVGNKTGSGPHGAVNDVAIVWPPHRAPILIAAYLSGSTQPVPELDSAHVEIGRLVASAFA